MAAWFSLERLAYARTKGEHWFLQILPELIQRFRRSRRQDNQEALQLKDMESGGNGLANSGPASTPSAYPFRRPFVSLINTNYSGHSEPPKEGKKLSAKMAVVVSQVNAPFTYLCFAS